MAGARLIAATALLTLTCLCAAGVARSASQSSWYWSSGLCKSQLKNYRLQIGPGANAPVLASTAAYCVGLHNRCWMPHDGKRLYKVFTVYILSKDSVVRTFRLDVTGKNVWRGSPLRIVARDVTAAKFASVYGAKARAAAAHEAALGCTDPTTP